MIMISITPFARWYAVPLFLALFLAQLSPHPAHLMVTGALALMASSPGHILSLCASVSALFVALAEGFSTINAVLVLVMCVYPVLYCLTLGTAGDSDSPSAGSQWRGTTDSTPEAIPDSEPSYEYQKWARSTFSKGGTSPITPPATPPRTTGTTGSTYPLRASDTTWNYSDSLRGHGMGYRHGYEYGQRRAPFIAHTSLHSGDRWSTPSPKGGSMASSAPGTRIYLDLKQPYVTVRSAQIPTILDPVCAPPVPKPSPQPPSLPQPSSPAQLPSPPPTPVALHVPAKVKTTPTFVSKKPARIVQKALRAAPFRYQKPSYLVRQSRRTSRSASYVTSGLPVPLAASPTQDMGSPMIVDFEDEPLVLADRLELLSIISPQFSCAKKVQDMPFAPLIKMASPINGHGARDGGLVPYFHDFIMEIDQDSDSSDDDDDSMDVDPTPVESGDVDMDAWDHPPVESPLLGNNYAPSLRHRFSGLYLGPDDHNMAVDNH
ncbi:hypothetical protein BDN71DRAFT_119217 [Pleurotus eryngii]|uniref:Uncharacterized protein n=1 Tax=Pleurotus eryngii TaxID=5323 RepID=A0A9P6DCA9_PLEER|nr:hypothetical protein BDN71DRAFT_119217 [Pleurotus eryngii]